MSELRATYLGHATTLIEGSGSRVLTDPLLRSNLMGVLRRRHARPEVETRGLDGVLISHVHHDHLDLPSLRRLDRRTPFVVPRGAGALLSRKGFAEVHEIAAGEVVELGSLRVEATPAVHLTNRRGAEEADTLGYLVGDGGVSAYFAGDTAQFDEMAEIGAAGLDLALLPIGGWGPTLGPGHMDPEQAAAALEMLRPRRVVPIHWGTYTPIGAPRIWPWMTHSPGTSFAEQARRVAPDTEVVILAPGESVSSG